MRSVSFFKARALDEFECVALDGAEVVVEISGCGWSAVTEERLHVAEVAGGLEHGDGGGAAQVVRDDAAVEVEALRSRVKARRRWRHRWSRWVCVRVLGLSRVARRKACCFRGRTSIMRRTCSVTGRVSAPPPWW